MRHGSAGFTLIELVVVIVILGVLAAVSAPNLTFVSPKYELRSGARMIGSSINWAHSLAGGTGSEYTLYYDIDSGTFAVLLPPGPDDDPELDFAERDPFEGYSLPKGCRIEKILLPDGTFFEDGEVYIPFDGEGHYGSQIVYLTNEDDMFLCVRYNSLLGVTDYTNERVEFEVY